MDCDMGHCQPDKMTAATGENRAGRLRKTYIGFRSNTNRTGTAVDEPRHKVRLSGTQDRGGCPA